MAKVRLKIDLGGTVGDEAWKKIQPFGEMQSAAYGAEYGSSGECEHDLKAPHGKGEWRGALITLATPLLAQYAVSHYLEQEGVLDADVEE